MNDLDTQHVTVLIADDHLPEFKHIVKNLREHGLTVDGEMEFIGTVSGSIGRDRVDELFHVEGVKDVERQRTFTLPDPSADLQ